MEESKKRESILAEKQFTAAPRIVLICGFSVYILTVLWYTIGRREAGYYPNEYALFWSYKLWLAGRTEYGHAILANIAMFVPFGFLIAAMQKGAWKKTMLTVFLLSVVFSCLIEAFQFMLLRGCFEYDDIINNAAGALLGASACRLAKRVLPPKALRSLLLGAGAGTVLGCLGVFLLAGGNQSGSLKPLSQGLCFQVESAAAEEGRLEMTGVCFWYKQGRMDYDIVLQSTREGKKYTLKTECGLPRPDVKAYFHRDDDKAGFAASGQGVPADEEYEIVLDFGFFRSIPTGVYLTVRASESGLEPMSADIHAVPDALYRPLAAGNTDLEEIAANGVLRVYQPAHGIYVYWYEHQLYWIAEEAFQFDDDGSTRLELEFRTTEMEKVPKKLWMANGKYALLGVYFEKNELTGNFGPYRVCSMQLPTAYPLTSIKTGYYSGEWVWQQSFWPVYDFSSAETHAD